MPKQVGTGFCDWPVLRYSITQHLGLLQHFIISKRADVKAQSADKPFHLDLLDVAAVSAAAMDPMDPKKSTASAQSRAPRLQSMLCYACRRIGHFACDCHEKDQSCHHSQTHSPKVTCHVCDCPGLLVKDYRELKEYKRTQGQPTAAAPSSGNPERCLCMPNGGNVPRIYVFVCVCVCALEGGDWRRVTAEVNTCSSRSLVSRYLVVMVDGSP